MSFNPRVEDIYNTTPGPTSPKWRCDGCRHYFGSQRQWNTTKGWDSGHNTQGKLVSLTSRLCDSCMDNHKRWRGKWLR